MDAMILNVETLPLPLREKIHAPKVSVQERDGGFVLMPVSEGSGLRGIAKNDNLTTSKFLAYKQEDKELDR